MARGEADALEAAASVVGELLVEEKPASLKLHMCAGGFAGVAEHVIVYPIDTLKTHVQASKGEVSAVQAARAIVAERGAGALFRGLSVQALVCGPAHALMFAAYEQTLEAGGVRAPDPSPQRVALVGLVAGGLCTFVHDSVAVPAETIKQRLQLGHYRNALDCFRTIVASGVGSLYRSLPTTLATNIPVS